MWEAPTLSCVSYLCILFLGSTNLPRRQAKDKGFMSPLACGGTYSIH